MKKPLIILAATLLSGCFTLDAVKKDGISLYNTTKEAIIPPEKKELLNDAFVLFYKDGKIVQGRGDGVYEIRVNFSYEYTKGNLVDISYLVQEVSESIIRLPLPKAPEKTISALVNQRLQEEKINGQVTVLGVDVFPPKQEDKKPKTRKKRT